MERSLTHHETETSHSNSRSADRKSSRAGRKELHRYLSLMLWCMYSWTFLSVSANFIVFPSTFRWVWASGWRSPAPQIWLMGPRDTLVSFLPTPLLYLTWSCWNWSEPLAFAGLMTSNGEWETRVPAPPTKPSSSRHSPNQLVCCLPINAMWIFLHMTLTLFWHHATCKVFFFILHFPETMWIQ